MTEQNAPPGIDPRFDPRFQRGYVPDAAAPAPESASTPEQTQRDARLERAAPAAGFADPADLAPSVAAARGDAAGFSGPLAPGAAVADPAVASPAVASAVQDAAGAGEHRPDAAADAADAEEARAEPVLEAESSPRIAPARWFWIALAACAAFIVAGAVLYWVQASDPAYFLGGQPGFTQTMQQFVMALSPALVQAGVIGIAAVLVAWAVRGSRDSAGGR